MPTTLLMLPPQSDKTRAWSKRLQEAVPSLTVVVAAIKEEADREMDARASADPEAEGCPVHQQSFDGKARPRCVLVRGGRNRPVLDPNARLHVERLFGRAEQLERRATGQ